jgi:competence protein ComFC
MGILDLLFPKTCLKCHKSGGYICDNCLALVPKGGWSITHNYSIWEYSGVIRESIIAIKYKFAFDVAHDLATKSASILKSELRLKNAVLVPIPLHRERQNWRGFNQAEEIGKYICKSMNWSLGSEILIRPKSTKQQVGLRKSDRERNMRGKFAVNANASREALAKWDFVIVFDDVATTGATLKEAKKVLKKAGAKEVIGLTIAR